MSASRPSDWRQFGSVRLVAAILFWTAIHVFCFDSSVSAQIGLPSAGSVDRSFLNGQAGPDGRVDAIGVQPDGKVLIGGDLTVVNGISRNGIARLNPNGTLDGSFQNSLTGANGFVGVITLQSDGKVLIGGGFTKVNGVARNHIARLNADGTLDVSFQDNMAGADDAVVAITVQPDGKLLIGGGFGTVNHVARKGIARLNQDGTLDTSFQNNMDGAQSLVGAIALQPDGKVIIGGGFGAVNGMVRNCLARLNSDGSLDNAFQNNLPGPDNGVAAIALQANGKVLIGGSFTTVNGVSRSGIARLNADGTLDSGFQPKLLWGGFDPIVQAIFLQPDGKALIGGWFTTVNGVSRNYIARLNATGSLDGTFLNNLAGVSGPVDTLTLQSDGKVLVGGFFSTVNGVARNSIARLLGTNAVSPSIITQPSNETAVVGGPASFLVSASGTSPLRYQWTKNGLVIPGATNAWLEFSAVQSSDAGIFTAIITNDYASITSAPATLTVRAAVLGDLDFSFKTALPFWDNSSILAMARQPDGKVLIGGFFTRVDGVARNRIARLNVDGSLDNSFQNNLTGANEPVSVLAVQLDGKVLIAGSFTKVNGMVRNRIARLNADGTLDNSFQNNLAGANDAVSVLAVQPDGKILIAGFFTTVNGVARSGLARLNADGTLDTSFQNNNSVSVLAVQPDGKILVGGFFTTIKGVARTGLARLNADGTLDTSFQSNLAGPNNLASVSALAVQPDGKALIAGFFTTVNGVARSGFARLHADGTLDTTFQNNSAGGVSVLALQSDGKVLMGGNFTTVNGVPRIGIARLHADGTLDTSFQENLAGANNSVSALAVQPDGKVVIAGWFTAVNGAVRNGLAVLNRDGGLDTTFQGNLVGADGAVNALAVQRDGKVLIAGYFTTINGVSQSRIARLNADGTLDPSFQNNLAGANIGVLALQPDGKVLIGGVFGSINGVARNRIARLHVDGTLDVGFQNTLSGGDDVFETVLQAFAVQSDGKVLIGGGFTNVNGALRNRLARLNVDGTLDTSFQNNLAGANSPISALALQPDGKVLVGGHFTTINGVPRNWIARLNGDGTLDTGFQHNLQGANNPVSVLALQPDGKVLIGGHFTTINGVARNRIARLNANGTLDTTFQSMLAGANIGALAVQPDGKVLIGGWFSSINGVPRNGIARLNSDGTVDPSFQNDLEGANAPVRALALQPNGDVLIGGIFTTINGVLRPGVARLVNDAIYQVGQWTARPLIAARTNNLTGPANLQPSSPFCWDSELVYFNVPGRIEVRWKWYDNTEFSEWYQVADVPATSYEVGDAISRPAFLDASFVPPGGPIIVPVNGSPGKGSVWHASTQRLYATSPGEWTIFWTGTNANTCPRISARIQTVWPSATSRYQMHVANTPEVDLTGGGAFQWARLDYQEPGVGISEENVNSLRRFTAAGAGRSVVVLAPGDPLNPSTGNVQIQAVRTVQWEDPAYLTDHAPAIIGAPIVPEPAWHNAAFGGPYVLNERSRYCALSGYYDRAKRIGPVIPMNRDDSTTTADDMVLVYYEQGAKLFDPQSGQLTSSGIGWPYKSVRYDCRWPAAPIGTIIVASQNGSGPVPLSTGWQIYRQPDPTKPGYNANEEHALKLPIRGAVTPSALELDVQSLMVIEGGTARLDVKVTQVPVNTAILSISASRQTEGQWLAYWNGMSNLTELVLTKDNYAGPHSLVFNSLADDDAVDGTNSFNIRLTGDLVAEQTVVVHQADTNKLGVVINPRNFTVLEGDTNAFTLRLTRPPTVPVNLLVRPAANSDPSLGLVGPSQFTFSGSDWDQERTVTIQAREDEDYFSSTNTFEVVASTGLNGVNTITIIARDKDVPPEGIFALRDDLGDSLGTTSPRYSEPYVLATGTNSAGQASVLVYRVVAEYLDPRQPGNNVVFRYSGKAARQIQPFYPLSVLSGRWYEQSYATRGPYFQDRKKVWWAKAAGDDGGTADLVMKFFYGVQAGFDFPKLSSPPTVGTFVPLLDQRLGGTPGTPTDVTYAISWPDNVPELRVGETLVRPKFGLPAIAGQTSVEIPYEQSVAQKLGRSVELIDPTLAYSVPLAELPGDLEGKTATNVITGNVFFAKLPPHLRNRLWWEPLNQRLLFKGEWKDSFGSVEPRGYILLNVITERDLGSFLLNPELMSRDFGFTNKIMALASLAAQARQVDPHDVYDSLALTAGLGQGSGYVTLAFNNSVRPPAFPADRGTPVSLEIIKVTCPLYRGEIKVIEPDNPFDERLTLRHSGDFAGKADSYVFRWKYWPDSTGSRPLVVDNNGDGEPDGWLDYPSSPVDGRGALDAMVEESGKRVLKDYWYICRYRPTNPLNPCGTNTWSAWTQPAFTEGWIKRVLGKINPFDQKFTDYSASSVDTVVNMISQAGARSLGTIPLNQEALNEYGLIEIYESVLKRGIELSIDANASDDGANKALMGAARRLADLYALLGNEAYADASDPTIGFGTEGQYGNEATTIHSFMDQTATLLEEELGLLRGLDGSFRRDGQLIDVTRHPAYNRLRWNFTRNITGGEVAYALNYNIRANAGITTINAAAAQKLFPQGHGDAWGHYLSAMKNYYRLIRHQHFDWNSEVEYVTLGGLGEPIPVNYMDERKFAKIASAKAQTGVEIVSLTYRDHFTEDPALQWQGYPDGNTNRAWGVSDWGSRAGQGAFFDWVAGNALLPPESSQTGIQKVDRTTVTELRDIAASYLSIQEQVDKADSGLNPLGLSKNTIPFDIDPDQISAGKSHFEQIYERAVAAINNAKAVFDHANNSSQTLRRQADSVADFQRNVVEREADFNNRLIEVFGYPYGDDIGPTGSYPKDYNGPDIYHYMYADPSAIIGETVPSITVFTVTMNDQRINPDGSLSSSNRLVTFHLANNGLGLVKPPHWVLPRKAPGEIQRAHSDLLQAKARFERAFGGYQDLLAQIEDKSELLRAQYRLNTEEINILVTGLNQQESLNTAIRRSRNRQLDFQTRSRMANIVANAVAEALPRAVGLASDTTSPLRSAIMLVGSVVSEIASQEANSESLVELDHQQAKELTQSQANIRLTTARQELGELQELKQLEQTIRQEALLRLELYTMQEAMQQAAGNYSATLARGQRILEDRMRFRQQTAEQVQNYRYKDMAFRIFRNDALQKYRAQFDAAAMYVYLAAKAYDFETNLRPGDPGQPGREFLTQIVRARTVGKINSGIPEAAFNGDPGLADPMARMSANFAVLKPQLGFNNQQATVREFSLRSQLLRVVPGTTSSAVWRDALAGYLVPNLNDIPEVRQHFIFEGSQPQEPGLVIRFTTTVNQDLNFFGWPAGPGDSSFNPTAFSTKVKSVSVSFANYRTSGQGGMQESVYVYLVPVGSDIARTPRRFVGDTINFTREWRIVDQWLPIPFQLSGGRDSALDSLNWIPVNAIKPGQQPLGDIRGHAAFEAWHDSLSQDLKITDLQFKAKRLIGRSVWNDQWLLVIPGVSLYPSDRNEGLKRFIHGGLVGGVRDGNGVSDIRLRIEAYSYSGR